MDTQQAYVIAGNGIAGVTAAEILRAGDTTCAITIIADDPFPAYYRPALKDYLGGRLQEESLWARPATFYQDQRIRFIPRRVVGINTMQRFVQLHNGKYIGYSKLLLANGAHPRSLSCPGLDLAGVSTLRTVADYQEILRRLSDVNRVVVCGSGTLALESAETLRHRDYQVTHLIRGNTLWSEVLDPIASDLVLQEERRDGIDVRTGEEIAEIVGKHGQVSGVITTQGEHISCEMVLIAIGIEPRIDFIRASGIACGSGVKVDNGMRTNIPDIYAAGDVIETTNEFTGRTRVLGQWFPSIQQAQIAAYNMLGLLTPDHPFYPGSNSELRAAYLNYYNATFLYGLDFVSIGLTTRTSSAGYQEIVADPQPRSYRKAILKNGTIVGALLLGNRKQGLAFKRAIDHRANPAPVAHQLFADNFDLDGWLDQKGIPGPILNIKKEGVSEDSEFEKHGVTPSLTSEEYTRNFLAKDVDAYFVPIPHPKVQVFLTETQLNKGGQSNVISIAPSRGFTRKSSLAMVNTCFAIQAVPTAPSSMVLLWQVIPSTDCVTMTVYVSAMCNSVSSCAPRHGAIILEPARRQVLLSCISRVPNYMPVYRESILKASCAHSRRKSLLWWGLSTVEKCNGWLRIVSALKLICVLGVIAVWMLARCRYRRRSRSPTSTLQQFQRELRLTSHVLLTSALCVAPVFQSAR
jgi:NADPH-dependent 2,4-dienoyl-CoA reductase/sulfur reductase-like enzyme